MNSLLDTSYEYFSINGDEVTLRAKKPPRFVRGIFFFYASLFYLLPISFLVINLATGGRASILNFASIGFMGLVGFYFLRSFLWNNYGSYSIKFFSDKIEYQADFKYFKK